MERNIVFTFIIKVKFPALEDYDITLFDAQGKLQSAIGQTRRLAIF